MVRQKETPIKQAKAHLSARNLDAGLDVAP